MGLFLDLGLSFRKSDGSLAAVSDFFNDGSDLFLYTMDSDGTDSKVGGTNLTATGTLLHTAPGQFGNMLTYDATNYYSRSNNLPVTDFTISLWFEPVTADGNQIRIMGTTDVGGANGLQIERDSLNKLIFILWNGVIANRIDSTSTYGTANGLNHVVWSYNDTTGVTDLYINTVLDTGVNVTIGSAFLAHQATMFIGKIGATAGAGSGNIDQVRAFSRTVSAAEVAQLFAEKK